MSEIRFSFIMTTRNKLPALRHALPRLIEQARPDEEIIVVDGASTDGAAEYVDELRRAGRIQQYLSEPDRGESHALNKALLLARGDLIKFITDDDAFHWPTVRACQRFLGEHPGIDAVFTDGADTDWALPDPFLCGEVRPRFEEWMRAGRPALLSCLGLVLRRRCLPLTGLFHTGIIPVDHEFSLRMTSIPMELALYTGYGYVRVLNPKSNTVTYQEQVWRQSERIRGFYLDGSDLSAGRRLFNEARRAMRPLIGPYERWIQERLGTKDKKTPGRTAEAGSSARMPHDWPKTLRLCEDWLEAKNRRVQADFLFRPQRAEAAEERATSAQ